MRRTKSSAMVTAGAYAMPMSTPILERDQSAAAHIMIGNRPTSGAAPWICNFATT
jgi:hypothetical protein